MGFFFRSRGDWSRTEKFLGKRRNFESILRHYGAKGVTELAKATPKDTGEAAASWYYEIQRTDRGYTLSWNNSKRAGRAPLVVLLQYGHGTRGGTWVPGRDFINPAMRGVLQGIADELWKEVLNG